MSTRFYPLYQRGNPQLRIFLPNFWMKLIRSEEPLPPNVVLFQTSLQMTDYDVRNYLEKIYKIPVVEVKTTIKSGKIKKCFEKQNLIKENDYKEALVTLAKDTVFEFPDITSDSEEKKEMERYKQLKEQYRAAKAKNKHRPGTPTWFVL